MSNNLYYSILILCLLNRSDNDFCYFSNNFCNLCNNLATVSSLIILFHILPTLLPYLFCPYMTTLKSHLSMSLIRLHYYLLLLYFDLMPTTTFFFNGYKKSRTNEVERDSNQMCMKQTSPLVISSEVWQ